MTKLSVTLMMTESLSMNGSSLRLHEDLTGQIHMHLSVNPEDAVILVEGVSDRLALSDTVDRHQIFLSNDRNTVFLVAKNLVRLGDTKFICVFDQDFWDEDPDSVPICHLYPYSGADLEAAVLDLGYAENILESSIPSSRLTEQGGANSIYLAATAAVGPLSRARKANHIHGWGIAFGDVGIGGFVARDGTLKISEYLNAVLLKSIGSSRQPAVNLEEINSELDSVGQVNIYRGRDVLQILAAYMRMSRTRSKAGLNLSAEFLETSLHAAAPAMLSNSDWGKGLVERIEIVKANFSDS